MNHPILEQLHNFVGRESIDLAMTRSPLPEEKAYLPIAKYILDLAHHTKPETASEHLFRELAKDVLDVRAFSQVNIGDGFVDFILPDVAGSAVVVELKPLFQLHHKIELRRYPLKPKQHLDQVKKYLHRHEYVILTDLKDAWLFSARDTLVDGSWFAQMPFAELLERAVETRSLLDTLRRAEDAVEKPELDRQFFEDLKDWFTLFREIKFTRPDNSAELVILLINKLVFAKTLEDHGLVPYRFVLDEYEKQKERWSAKGPPSYIRSFLVNVEEFFDEYYDTELFEKKIWDHLDRSPDNLARFARSLDLVLGISKWDKVFSRGIVHYNYRQINEDIFGKSYEMFLAANRKDEGIYYTPAPITTPMADSLVESLFGPLVEDVCSAVAAKRCDFAAADSLMARLGGIRIADTAAGSGGFLIKVLRAIWAQYLRIESASRWVKDVKGDLFEMPANVQQAAAFRAAHALDSRRVLVARILLRHIYAVDKDAGALEVAKTNVWKEAVKLSPPDYNFRQLTSEAQRILPNLELNFLCADSLVDVDTGAQAAHLSEYSAHATKQLWALRDKYVEDPSDHAPLEKAMEIRGRLREHLAEHFQHEALPEPPAFLALMFFPCWIEPSGAVRENPGFDGIIGNPPWEAVKPVRKEFARIEKYSMSVVDFDKWFTQKLDDEPEFKKRWEAYQKFYEDYKTFLGRSFEHQGTGDWNYFKLFIERDLRLIRNLGRLSLLVPSSIQTDEGCSALRKLLIFEHTFDEITSFENRGYTTEVNGELRTVKIFPDVDNRFKFGFFKVLKGQPSPPDHVIAARFYLHDPARAFDPPIRYSVATIPRFSPQNLSLMEFRNEVDYRLYMKIRGEHALLGNLGYTFRRELHMTGDSRFFHKYGMKRKKGEMVLYEGKMIHQFHDAYQPAMWCVREDEVRPELLRKEVYRIAQYIRVSNPALLEGEPLPKKTGELERRLVEVFEAKCFQLQYQLPRLAYREVASSTNERTLIAAGLPGNVCLGHTLMYLNPYRYELDGTELKQFLLIKDDTDVLLAIFNSLVLNYFLRSKVSTHVSIFQLNELPIPQCVGKLKKALAASAAKLSTDPSNTKERAKLEVFIARDLYGLNLDDWKHLTGTFTYGDGPTKQELDEIIRLSIAGW